MLQSAAVQCSLKAALPFTLRAGLDDPLEHVVQAGIQGLPASYLEMKTMGRWPFHKLVYRSIRKDSDFRDP